MLNFKLTIMKLNIKNSILVLCIILFAISCEKDDEVEMQQEDVLEMLQAPENLVGSTDFALKIELNWDVVMGAISYQVYRKDATADTSIEFELIGESEVNSYIDLDVESNSEYQYFVRAYNGLDSDSSDIVFASTRFITAEEAFDVLAEYTGGIAYESPNAAHVSDRILTVIENHVEVASDLVFLIDNTGSMADDIHNVRTNLTEIIDALPPSVRVGVAEYGDNNVDEVWFEYLPLSTDYSEVVNYINNITTTSGGDVPESVYDGIYETIEVMDWLSGGRRVIVVIGDAPPLEGDLTNHTLSEVINFANSESVSANLYPILVY